MTMYANCIQFVFSSLDYGDWWRKAGRINTDSSIAPIKHAVERKTQLNRLILVWNEKVPRLQQGTMLPIKI